MDSSPLQHPQNTHVHPMDVGIAAYNVQPSSSTLPVPQQQLGCSPPGQSQHIQHGLCHEHFMIPLFPFPKCLTQSAYTISLTLTVVLTPSTDAQHRHSALLSALTCPSHQGTTTHMHVMRPRCLITASTPQYAFLS